MNASRLGVALAVALLLPACATVTRGTQQKYVITSQPEGAAVALTTGQTCVTPCKLKLKRKHDFTARFTKEGFEPAEAQVESKFSGGGGAAAAGNILIGGIIGGVVDGSNGSLNNLFPDKLDVVLKPVAVADAAAPVAVAETTAAAAAEPAVSAVETPAASVPAPTGTPN
ncbi:PEGA domain-containing protein [Sphingomonas sp. KC8]|uniref:PEGA domain-containing protein n=1 Tax=Sphingomonas sp. KC8 TaxID=1030157 RepID=UPI0002488527|nr:PEGA domain-containing protein [Sphingomonas sp. KC8]ARS26728.1 translation initiation factor 2 [Sphingomonas sp. KC8]